MKNTKRAELEEGFMCEMTFTTAVSLHRDYGGENFLHEIFGKISIRNVDTATEEIAGEIRVWLIQFMEAQVHGISSRVLMEGQSFELGKYWQDLFDMDDFKTEIQSGWQPEGSDLLVLDSVRIADKFEKFGFRLAVLGRTIDLFSRSCDLVACFPEEVTPERGGQNSSNANLVLQTDCLKAGFRPWCETGIYLLNPTYERPDVLLE